VMKILILVNPVRLTSIRYKRTSTGKHYKKMERARANFYKDPFKFVVIHQ